MKFPRLLLFTGIIIIALSWLSNPGGNSSLVHKRSILLNEKQAATKLNNDVKEKLAQKASVARSFVQKNDFNETVCFLIDMSLPSGQNRFFIYNLRKDSLQNAGLVAHGNCFQNWLEGRKYSNIVGCGCTSLGRYRIGNPYTGKFGYSYKLYGLDSTNNNAFERTVVLHSHTCIPETETTDDICQSNGCPMVSPGLLQQLKVIINRSRKPILLWIYDQAAK